MVDGPGREAAVGQPGTELGAVIAAQHAVASLEVVGQQVCVPQIVLQPCQGFCLASLEAVHCLKRTCRAFGRVTCEFWQLRRDVEAVEAREAG